MNDVPRHIAIIMDGNGRWATRRRKKRTYGHRHGVTAAREIVLKATELNVKMLSLFAFSSENRARPRAEVMALTELFSESLKEEIDQWLQYNIRLNFIGDLSFFNKTLRERMRAVESETRQLDKMQLNIALNYSGRWDIAESVRGMLRDETDSAVHRASRTDDIINAISSNLVIDDVDLLIRTGSESRLSNFLLWQCAYAELYFSKTLWPDFSPAELESIIAWYAGRERRFGLTATDGAETDGNE